MTGTITLPFEEGPRSFPTLENADCIIPSGTYPLKRTWSPRFKKNLPLVEDVPEREGIRIHMGTKPEHSQGCILTDFACMAHMDVLFNRIEKHNDEFEDHEEIRLQIL